MTESLNLIAVALIALVLGALLLRLYERARAAKPEALRKAALAARAESDRLLQRYQQALTDQARELSDAQRAQADAQALAAATAARLNSPAA